MELLNVPYNELIEVNCYSSGNEVVCTDQFSEFSVLKIAVVHETLVEVNKNYCSLDAMPISVVVKCSEFSIHYFLML